VHEWAAEIEVDEDAARRLIGGQFPERRPRRLRLLARGWDNAVWLADGRWAFRFPRRRVAVPGVEREIAVLPQLAALLPLPVPVPRYRGRPDGGYPWPFFGCRLLPGEEVATLAPGDRVRAGVGRRLGGFLRALHDPAVTAAIGARHRLPVDPMGRADMRRRVPRHGRSWPRCGGSASGGGPPRWTASSTPRSSCRPPGPAVVAHGDLHVRHLLLDPGGPLSAVIDWGDLCLAPASADLSLLWSFLPPGGRDGFLDAYGEGREPLGETELLRARVLALFLCARAGRLRPPRGAGAAPPRGGRRSGPGSPRLTGRPLSARRSGRAPTA
jgi:aminoglycoside phosphotransferase (APT) family kinase protein